MSSQCPGCSKTFTASGLSNHLAQTRNTECISARDAAHQAGSTPCKSPSPPALPEDFDIDAEPVLFEGDYFGSYTDADFDDDHPDSGSYPSDSDPEDDDDLNEEVETQGWEPPPRSLDTALRDLAPAMDDTPDRPESEWPDSNSAAERRAAEESLRRTRNTFVASFPLDSAGAPIPPSQCSAEIRERVSYEHYQHRVHGTKQNPYAPFTCRRDWEIAKWAKMRGPGSTSLSDLLAIDGVCFIPDHTWFHFVVNHSMLHVGRTASGA